MIELRFLVCLSVALSFLIFHPASSAKKKGPSAADVWASMGASEGYKHLTIFTRGGDELKLSLSDTSSVAKNFHLLIQNLEDTAQRLGGEAALARSIGLPIGPVHNTYTSLTKRKNARNNVELYAPRLFFMLNKAQNFLQHHPEHDLQALPQVVIPTDEESLHLSHADINTFRDHLESVIDYISYIIAFLRHNDKREQFNWFERLDALNLRFKTSTLEENKQFFYQPKSSPYFFNVLLKRLRELHRAYDPYEVFQVGKEALHSTDKAIEETELEEGQITPQELLDHYSHDFTKTDIFNRTLLFYAVKTEPLATIEHLVGLGAVVDAVDVSQDSPFEWAVFLGRFDVVQYLWPKVKKIRAKKDGWRAYERKDWLQTALIHGHTEVAAFLFAQGVKLYDLTWAEAYEHNFVRDRHSIIKWLNTLATQGVFEVPTDLWAAKKNYLQRIQEFSEKVEPTPAPEPTPVEAENFEEDDDHPSYNAIMSCAKILGVDES